MDVREELLSHLRIATVIAGSVIASLFVMFAAEEVIRAVFRPFRGFAGLAGDLLVLQYAFIGLGIVVIVLIRVLRQVMLVRKPGEDAKSAIHRLQRASVVTLVLGEVPGIAGLVLFLLSGLNIVFYALVFASLCLVFIYFPRLSSWEEWLKA